MDPIVERYMRVAAYSLLLGLLGGAGSTACLPYGAFFCTEDVQCRHDGAVGTCEAVGFCSFSDDACPSGRRFGELAEGALASACVGQADEGDESGASGSTGDSEGRTPSLPDHPSSTDADTNDTPFEGESTGGGWASTGEESMESESSEGGGSESGEDDSDCGFFVLDEFEGSVIDGSWTQTKPPGAVIAQQGGQLELGIPASPASNIIVTRALEHSMAGGYLRAHLTEIASSNSAASSGIVVGVAGCDLMLYAHEGMLRAVRVSPSLGAVQVGSETLSGELPQWLQLRQDADGMLHFERSLDGVQWVEVASGDFSECGDITLAPQVGVFAGGSASFPVTRRIDAVSICASSGE
jgi:hypothetical protein